MKDVQEPIAIIGIGCRYPGKSNSPDALWKMLMDKTDAVTEIPQDRWNINKFYHAKKKVTGKTYSKWGGFIEDIDQFDPECFSISPREANVMDPQQRLLLEVAWNAIEDSGHQVEELSGTNAGVFIGLSTNDYSQIQLELDQPHQANPYVATGGAFSIAANRISYCFDFHGPSFVVDTACSSSLVATHQACASILNDECEIALAGGANLILLPTTYISFCAATMLSPDGRCRAFDAKANGFVRGEGAGMVVLKRLSAALANNDSIYAVINASGVNQDGHTNGITLPSHTAQAALIESVYKKANIDRSQVFYVEAHGTGTAVGDPIEAGVLGEMFGSDRTEGDKCIIGSIKTNIGHLESGAGMAGLIKAALCIKNRVIPPNLHFLTPNPNIPFDELKLQVPVEPVLYPDSLARQMNVGVNSFGFGGTNAHVVLSEFAQHQSSSIEKSKESNAVYILPLSARSTEGLKQLAQSYIDFLGTNDKLNIADLVYSVCRRKSNYAHRLSLVAENLSSTKEQLQAYINDEQRIGLFNRQCQRDTEFKLAFVFSGQGPQWWAMGRELLQNESVFRETIISCDRLMSQYADWSLLAELTADEEDSRISETEISQPLLFAIQISLAALWQARGIKPDAVVGHSVGEVAAAHIAGALDLPSAIKVIFFRGLCMSHATGQGGMIAAALTLEQANQVIAPFSGKISVAAINSPSSLTLSGHPELLKILAVKLDQKGIFNKALNVQFAFHSAQMDPIQPELLKGLEKLQLKDIHTPIYSTVLANRVEENCFNADYWWLNIREKVSFAPVIQDMIADGYNLFIEISPHPVLMSPILECAQGNKITVIPSLRRNEDECRTMMGAFGNLFTLGYAVDWKYIHKNLGKITHLPGYPWQKQRYWSESEKWLQRRAGKTVHPLLSVTTDSADPTWNTLLDTRNFCYLVDHKVRDNIVFPAAGYIEMTLAAGHELVDNDSFVIEDIQIQNALYLAETKSPTIQFSFNETDSSFVIRASTSLIDKSWTSHCIGYLRKNSKQAENANVDELKKSIGNSIAMDMVYQRFANSGLVFGPAFRAVTEMSTGDGQALAKVQLLESNQQQASAYHFHPALLDACFQTLFGTLQEELADNLYLPVAIDHLRYYQDASDVVWVHAQRTHANNFSLAGNISVYSSSGQLLIDILGFRCRGVNSTAKEQNKFNELYQYSWLQSPLKDIPQPQITAEFLPDCRQILESLQPGELDQKDGMTDRFNALAISYIVNAFIDLGCSVDKGDCLSINTLIAECGVKDKYRQLVFRFFQILEQQNYLQIQTPDTGIVLVPFTVPDLKSQWSEALANYAGAFAELTLIRLCGTKLAAVLIGDQDPLPLQSLDSNSAIVEYFYADSPSFKPGNRLMQKVVSKIVDSLPCGKNLRVLEIGAGTGGMTTYLLNMFAEERVEYYFTDVSSAYFSRVEQRFKEYPFVNYQLLNIEQGIQQQDYELHSFDIVLASNVLHMTQDLAGSLDNIHSLLRPSGLLLFLEAEEKHPWLDIVCGLTEEWWHFTDKNLRPHHPLLPRTDWNNILQARGYLSPTVLSDSLVQGETSQVLLMAQAEDIISHQTDSIAGITEVDHNQIKHWLIFADQTGVASALLDRIKQTDACYTLIFAGESFNQINDHEYQIIAGNKQQLGLLFQALTTPSDFGIVHLWSLDVPNCVELGNKALIQSEVLSCHTVLYLIQALTEQGLIDKAERLLLVTKGAQALQFESEKVALEQSPIIGLARVIQDEHPELKCKAVDLDPAEHLVDALFAELITENNENEVVLRYGERFAPRLKQIDKPCIIVDNCSESEVLPFRLEVEPAGAINNLRLKQVLPVSLQPEEVEIQVHAVSLNFRDVMKTMGLYPTDDGCDWMLGDECSGIVTAVGSKINDIKVGDQVVAVAPGGFASKVTTLRQYVIPKPAHLSDEEAVTIPIVFLTVYYALHHLARIQKGDKILIQAAAGGVGLAAVQIAKNAGAEVFVTAGSDEKRELLHALGVDHIMNSRSLAFSDEIMSITAGQGVDIVLNSLAGDAISKGFDCLAPYGRFLELGKIDIYQNSKIGLWAFRKNLAFFAIDLSRMLIDKPDLVGSMLKEVYQLISDRVLAPLPHRVFPITRIKEAFTYMAQGKHIGKVVVSLQEQAIPIIPLIKNQQVQFHGQASYLITGGFGGFGITLAHWIIQQGGQNIILAGRSGGGSEQAQQSIAELKAKGANVWALKTDVSDTQQFSQQLDQCLLDCPPIKGIFHMAMVMDDGVITQLDAQRFSHVMAPKVQGAWNLHDLSKDMKLDYFVMFSSISTLLGNAGQANYVAANHFLDMFAHYRRNQGLPAISINWGALLEVGYLSQYQNVSLQLEKKGILGLLPDEAMQFLQKILRENPIQTGPAHINWNEWGKKYLNRHIPLRYSLLIDQDKIQANQGDNSNSIRLQIDEANPGQCFSIISQYMREQVAAVLRVSADKLELEQPLNELGLDSLMMVELGIRIENDLSVSLPTSQLMQAPSMHGLSKVVMRTLGKSSSTSSRPSNQVVDNDREPQYPASLITLKPGTTEKTLFCFHSAGGRINDYNVFVEKLADDIQVMGLQSCVYAGAEQEFSSIELMAEEYVKIIQKQQPQGPYNLLGYSFGGVVCLAVAGKLLNLDQQVSFVGLIDSEIGLHDNVKKAKFLNRIIPDMAHYFFNEVALLNTMPEAEKQQNIDKIQQVMVASKDKNFEDIFVNWLKNTEYQIDKLQMEVIHRFLSLFRKHAEIISKYTPKPLTAVPIYVWQASEGYTATESERKDWDQLSKFGVNFEILLGNHYSLLKSHSADYLAEHISKSITAGLSIENKQIAELSDVENSG